MRQAHVEALSWMRKDGKRGEAETPPRMRKGHLLCDSTFEERPRPIIRACGTELGKGSFLNGTTLHEDDAFISANPCKTRVRRREHHSTFRLTRNRLQSLAHRKGIHLVKPRCRFRDKQYEGTLRKRTGDSDKTPLKCGKRAYRAIEMVAQAPFRIKRAQHAINLGGNRSLVVDASLADGKCDGVANALHLEGATEKHAGGLLASALSTERAVSIMPAKLDRAAHVDSPSPGKRASQCVKHGRDAASSRATKGCDLAFRDVERDILQRGECTETQGKLAHANERRCGFVAFTGRMMSQDTETIASGTRGMRRLARPLYTPCSFSRRRAFRKQALRGLNDLSGFGTSLLYEHGVRFPSFVIGRCNHVLACTSKPCWMLVISE